MNPEAIKNPALAVAQVRESLDISNSLSPSEITARIEAEELPSALVSNLDPEKTAKLRQVKYEHNKAARKAEALKLIQTIQNQINLMDQTV